LWQDKDFWYNKNMLPDKKIQKVIIQNNLFQPEQITEYLKAAEKEGKNLEEYLIVNNLLTEEILYNSLANFYNLPFVGLRDKAIPKDVLFLIPEPIASNYGVIAFEKTDKDISLAMTDPENVQIIEFIERKTNLPLKIFVTTPSAILESSKLYHKNLETELASIEKKTGGKLSVVGQDPEKHGTLLENLAKDLPVIRVVDTLLEYAIFEGASDIHIEPSEKTVVVRYRVDGILRDAMTLPKELKDGITARIKVLSNLKLDEHRLPQDGRFKIETKDYKISFRVSLLPIFDGEKVVMRLLNESKKILSLKDLGLSAQALQIVDANLKKPNGMLLVTGPTGSGKTTTLYTMMDVLNTPKVNISTVEDPIEYRMPRINQSQVSPKIGFTFANGLRSLLRQDPDIIMVGEIRDKETAGIAINAAMTGHLVLSTLHTNDAPSTLPRLLDMGIEPFLVSSTVNMILAQRLVRKICKDCVTSYTLQPKEIEQLEKDHEINIKELEAAINKAEGSESENKNFGSILFFKGKGCTKCGNQGFKGRVGIYEVLSMSEEIKVLITTRASADEIKAKSREQGMISMLEDGLLKAKAGITTIEEVLRVTKE